MEAQTQKTVMLESLLVLNSKTIRHAAQMQSFSIFVVTDSQGRHINFVLNCPARALDHEIKMAHFSLEEFYSRIELPS